MRNKNPKSIQKIIHNDIINADEEKTYNRKKNISTKKLKLLFYSEAKEYYLKLRREFTMTPDDKVFYNILCHYFAEDTKFENQFGGQLQKGLWIYSKHNGTGKTGSLKIIQSIAKKYNLRKLWFPFISTQEVISKYNQNSNNKDYIIKYYSKGAFAFDDLGAEKQVNNYGREDIFIRILSLRYEEFIAKGIKTHITSNLSFEEAKKRYGDRIYDRLFEMFNLIQLNGETKRF